MRREVLFFLLGLGFFMLVFLLFSPSDRAPLTGFAIGDGPFSFINLGPRVPSSSSAPVEVIEFGLNQSKPRFAIDPELRALNPSIISDLEQKGSSEVILSLKQGRTLKTSLPRERISEQFSYGGMVVNLSAVEFKQLLGDDAIEQIEPMAYFDVSLQDSVSITSAQTAWTRTVNSVNITGQGRTICFIDTGINFSHPDLLNKNVVGCNVDCVANPCRVNCTVTDLNGHGTHVAGIAAANGGVKGIAPDANLIGVKVFSGSSGTGASTASIVRGLTWCGTLWNTYNVSVISVSISSAALFSTHCDSSFTSLRNTVNSLMRLNVSVVASSGNDGDPTRISSPACLHNVTAVSATNKNDTPASYSNFASTIQLLAAPGTSINSTCLQGGYCEQTGTSMSTPMVAGALTLLTDVLSRTNQKRTPAQLELVLNATGVRVPYSNGTTSRINIDRALLTFDVLKPTIIQSSPSHLFQTPLSDYTFICNASDWQLASASMTLYRPALNLVVFNQTRSVNGSFASVDFNITNISAGKYSWWCNVSDVRNNTNVTSTNFTFIVGGVRSILDSPTNGAVTASDPVPFVCNATTPEGIFVSNSTLFVWNVSNDVVYSDTLLPSVNLSSVSFAFSADGLDDGVYSWNCLAQSSVDDRAFALFNRTLSIDRTPPIVNLTSPSDESAFTTAQMPISFSFTVTDESSPFCSLLVDDVEINSGFASMNGTSSFSMSHTFPVGGYTWSVNCTDLVGNLQSSEVRSFDVDVAPSTGGGPGAGGGGGGGGGAAPRVPPAQNSNASDNSSVPSDSGSFTPNGSSSDSPEGVITTGRSITDFSGRSFSWILIVLIFAAVAYGCYRYLRARYERTQAYSHNPRTRHLIPLSLREGDA